MLGSVCSIACILTTREHDDACSRGKKNLFILNWWFGVTLQDLDLLRDIESAIHEGDSLCLVPHESHHIWSYYRLYLSTKIST